MDIRGRSGDHGVDLEDGDVTADDPDAVRPVFASMRGLRDVLVEQFGEGVGQELSMGMTNDYEEAILEGATMVRIGTAIFGERRE